MKKGMRKFGITVDLNRIFGNAKSKQERVCGEKRRLDQHAAESSALSLERRFEVPYDAYKCPYCGAWHAGHSRQFFTLEDKYGTGYRDLLRLKKR